MGKERSEKKTRRGYAGVGTGNRKEPFGSGTEKGREIWREKTYGESE